MRQSDRYVTPGVVIAGLTLATVVLLGIVGAVTFLTWQGFDPAPVVELVANLVAALGALGTLVLQLVNRATVAKVERNTGAIASGELERLSPAPTERRRRHAGLPPVPERGRAPGAGGS